MGFSGCMENTLFSLVFAYAKLFFFFLMNKHSIFPVPVFPACPAGLPPQGGEGRLPVDQSKDGASARP